MRLLLFSDVHADTSAVSRLVALARRSDLLIGAGDYACLHAGLKRTLLPLLELGKPAVLVSGNNERLEALRTVVAPFPHAHVLDGSAVQLCGQVFYGVGAAIPLTPFGPWSVDRTENEGRALLQGCPQGCILVTHAPPKGVLDADSRGRPLGSQAVREVILEQSPILCVSGHIHAQGGQHTQLEQSWVANAGARGILCNVEEGRERELEFRCG